MDRAKQPGLETQSPIRRHDRGTISLAGRKNETGLGGIHVSRYREAVTGEQANASSTQIAKSERTLINAMDALASCRLSVQRACGTPASSANLLSRRNATQHDGVEIGVCTIPVAMQRNRVPFRALQSVPGIVLIQRMLRFQIAVAPPPLPPGDRIKVRARQRHPAPGCQRLGESEANAR